MRAGMMREMGWQVDEEVNRDKTGGADGMNLEVDSKDEVDAWYLNERSVIFKEEMVGGRESVTTDEEMWQTDTRTDGHFVTA